MEGAIADVRANGGTIAYVRVGFTDADRDAILASHKSIAPLAHHRVMHDKDPAAAIHERLAPQDGAIIVDPGESPVRVLRPSTAQPARPSRRRMSPHARKTGPGSAEPGPEPETFNSLL